MRILENNIVKGSKKYSFLNECMRKPLGHKAPEPVNELEEETKEEVCPECGKPGNECTCKAPEEQEEIKPKKHTKKESSHKHDVAAISDSYAQPFGSRKMMIESILEDVEEE